MSNALTQTTLSAALAINSNVLVVASATGIAGPVANFTQKLYVIGPGQKRGELMDVVSVSGTQITVSRLAEYRSVLASGSLVLIGFQSTTAPYAGGPFFGSGFYAFDPPGTPGNTGGSTDASNAAAGFATPWVNVTNGNQWIYSSVVNAWVPGWQNDLTPGVCAAVASVAGPVTPSGPLFHMTGALAITGITRPIGFSFGSFTCIPDHAASSFTWTTGDASIAVAGTAIQFRALTFVYDPAAAVWYPSYV